MKITTSAGLGLACAAALASAAACGGQSASPASCKAAMTTAIHQVIATGKARPNTQACKGLSTPVLRQIVGEVASKELGSLMANAFAKGLGSVTLPPSYPDRIRVLLPELPFWAITDSSLNGLRASICGAEGRGASPGQVEITLAASKFTAAEARVLTTQAHC